MDDTERFLIAQEDNGTFLHIYIPGKRPDNWPVRQIKWTGRGPIPSFDDLRREAAVLQRQLKKKGLLENLPERTIPGYSHSYPYSFQPATIREINPDPKDQVYVRNDVAYNMRHMLWFPILKLLKEHIKDYDYIQLEIPIFPPVLTEDLCQAWYENNKSSSRFFDRLLKTSQNTRIETVTSESEITLKITNHPFVDKPIQRIQLLPDETIDSAPLSDDQLRTLHLKVLSRDSNMLKGLTNTERKQLRQGTNDDLVADYPIHWVRWLSLSGTMTEKNAILVFTDTEKSYQHSVRYPFEQYWRRNRSFFEGQNLPVYVEIPVPTNSYRPKPVARTLMPHQNRRYLNEMTRRAAEEYLKEKE